MTSFLVWSYNSITNVLSDIGTRIKTFISPTESVTDTTNDTKNDITNDTTNDTNNTTIYEADTTIKPDIIVISNGMSDEQRKQMLKTRCEKFKTTALENKIREKRRLSDLINTNSIQDELLRQKVRDWCS